jgi:crossover junction endodeoxyribonuclease RuvC
MGYGLLEQKDGRTRALEYGVFTSAAGGPLEDRLAELFGKLQRTLGKRRPDAVAVEELFFSRNVKTALVVGQARGVALLACALAGVPVFEYKPSEVKQAVTGYGGADKAQVQRMVKLLLGLRETPKPDDAADALAIALAHAQSAGTRLAESLKRMSRRGFPAAAY